MISLDSAGYHKRTRAVMRVLIEYRQ